MDVLCLLLRYYYYQYYFLSALDFFLVFFFSFFLVINTLIESHVLHILVFEPPKGVPTVFDPSFTGVGQKPGIEIWRVEKLAVVKKDPSDKAYKGQLYEGDAYIILHTKVG